MTAVHCSLSPWLWWRSLAWIWRLEAEVTWVDTPSHGHIIMVTGYNHSQPHQTGAGVRLLPGPDGAKQEASLWAARTRLGLGPGVREDLVPPVVNTSLVINLTRTRSVTILMIWELSDPLAVDHPLELSWRGGAPGVARDIDQVPDLVWTCGDGSIVSRGSPGMRASPPWSHSPSVPEPPPSFSGMQTFRVKRKYIKLWNTHLFMFCPEAWGLGTDLTPLKLGSKCWFYLDVFYVKPVWSTGL